MRMITLEEHFATPQFIQGAGQCLAGFTQLPLSPTDRARIAHGNAEHLLGL